MTDRARHIAVAFQGQIFNSEQDAHAWLLRQCPPKIFESEEDEGWIATVPALPGCSAFGVNYEEARREICDAMQAWLEALLSRGDQPKTSAESL